MVFYVNMTLTTKNLHLVKLGLYRSELFDSTIKFFLELATHFGDLKSQVRHDAIHLRLVLNNVE